MQFSGIPHAAVDFYVRLEEQQPGVLGRAQERLRARRAGADGRPPRRPGGGVRGRQGLPPAPRSALHRRQEHLQDAPGRLPRRPPRTGWSAEVSADGFRLGGGSYHLEPASLAAYRQAVDGPRGAELERIVADLREAYWEVGGDRVKTVPRGWSRDHERIELLRHKALSALRWIEDGDVVTTPRLVEAVREHWRAVRPLVEWLEGAVR